MGRKASIGIATAGALGVAALTLFLFGWDSAGLAAAARNTARFSGMIFALALVARSPRFPRWFARRWEVFWAFVAAHGVHYAAVVTLAVFDPGHDLHRFDPMAIVTLTGGFGILFGASLTVGTAQAPFTSRVHTLFFYLLGAIFLAGFASRAGESRVSAVIFGIVLMSALLRVLPAKRASTRSASA